MLTESIICWYFSSHRSIGDREPWMFAQTCTKPNPIRLFSSGHHFWTLCGSSICCPVCLKNLRYTFLDLRHTLRVMDQDFRLETWMHFCFLDQSFLFVLQINFQRLLVILISSWIRFYYPLESFNSQNPSIYSLMRNTRILTDVCPILRLQSRLVLHPINFILFSTIFTSHRQVLKWIKNRYI